MAKKRIPEDSAFLLAQGRLISEQMRSKKITQMEMAERLGLAQSTISSILNGKQNVTAKTLTSIAREVGVTVDDLTPSETALSAAAEAVAAGAEETAMSGWERKLAASKEAFLARHSHELSALDLNHVRNVAFLQEPVDFPDDGYWWDVVESGRRRRERARRRGDGN